MRWSKRLLLGILVSRVESITYFAYGSNMNKNVLTGRRGIYPLAMARGKVEDYRLAFSLRGGGLEPSFASIEAAQGEECHGLLLRLSAADWAKLCLSEGVPFAYQIEKISVRLYEKDTRYARGKSSTEALTLRSAPGPWRINERENEPSPSLRYINLLTEGARKRGLEQDWIETLEAFRSKEVNK